MANAEEQVALKQKANTAFAEKRYNDALQLYTTWVAHAQSVTAKLLCLGARMQKPTRTPVRQRPIVNACQPYFAGMWRIIPVTL